MTGEWPSHEIDHRDTNQANDSWENLRAATSGQNSSNTKRRSDNTSGFKGVTFDQARGKWAAKIQSNRHQYFLGRFDTPEAAYAIYCQASKDLHGDFSRTK